MAGQMIELNERGVVLYTYNDVTGEQREYYSSDRMNNYTGADNQELLDITDIDELNPTASSVYASGEGQILVYDSYDTTMNILFKGGNFRAKRSNFVNNVFYHIQEIGIVQNVFDNDQTLYRKKCLGTHVGFTENQYQDGIVVPITLSMRGTWYWLEDGNADNTVDYVTQGATVLKVNSNNFGDLYTRIEWTDTNGGQLSMFRRESKYPHADDASNDSPIAQYGAYISTDGQAYDMYPSDFTGGPVGYRSYADLGPSRQAEWAWGFYKDQDGGNSYGDIHKLKTMIYNGPVTYQAFNSAGNNITANVENFVFHYLDFI